MQTTNEPTFRYGVVEDVLDPLKLGRVRVRVAQIHTDNLGLLPTSDLPWAEVVQPVTSAAVSGIGMTPRVLPGSWVIVSFLDAAKQKPLVWGTVAGIPGSQTNITPTDTSTLQEVVSNVPPKIPPQPVATTNAQGQTVIVEPPYIGSLTNTQVRTLKDAIAKSETSGADNPYAVENSIGFIGKYQFCAAFLKDQGYIHKTATGKNKDIIDNPDSWTGKDDVTRKEVFFTKIDLQESLMDVILRANYKIMANAGILSIYVPPEKTAGLLMAAHLKGSGGAIMYARGEDSADAYGRTASKYYQLGYASIAGKSTVEQPTENNLTKPAADSKLSQPQDARKYDVGVSVGEVPQGFKDPAGRYPLKSQLNESDLNRLARGSNISRTIVGSKEADRTTAVPVANSGITWDQSPIPYATQYPHNYVIASASGHVLELDDTPGAERVNLHHKAGTFTEIDSAGNEVEKVAGIRTIIVEKDELVYIKGSGHVNIDGDLSVRVGGACNIEVIGNANLHVHGDLNQQIDGAYNLTANTISISAKSTAKIAAASALEIGSQGTFTVGGSGTMVNALGNIGAPIMLLATTSPDNKTVPSYSPTIQIPTPVSRQEAADFVLEGAEDVTSIIFADAPPANPPTKSDSTPAKQVIPVTGVCGFTNLTPSTQLTANYTLQDLANRHPFPFADGQHGKSAEELACNLKQLAINVIEPLREKYAAIGFKINSCFREAGSSISKSKKISQHELGQAVDIGFSKYRGLPNDRDMYYQLAQEIKDTVPVDQLLLEYRSNGSVWIHISYTSGPLRRQVLTMYNDKVFGEGLHLIT